METTQRLQVKIQGMTCNSCVIHVRKALETIPDIKEVNIPGWKSGKAEILASSTVTDEDIIHTVEAAGYRAIPGKRNSIPNKDQIQSKQKSFDLIVIGGGSAGFAAAIRASELGAKVALVEKGVTGGTCVNRGCIPSKTLMRSVAHYYRTIHYPFSAHPPKRRKIEWQKIIEQKERLVQQLRKTKYEDVLLAYPEISYIHGTALITNEKTVEIDGVPYSTNKIIVATGSHPYAPPIPGLSESNFLDSEHVMNLTQPPDSMIVIGGGSVGLELAQVFARIGTKVTILEAFPSILPQEEPEMSAALSHYLTEEGIGIVAGVHIHQINKIRGRVVLEIEGKKNSQTIEAEKLLIAAGRRANTNGLGLENMGVKIGQQGEIVIDEHSQTSNPNIYAAGDCTDTPMFVYVAAHSGSVAAENALNGNHRMLDLSTLPRVVFTDPQFASVGLTEKQAMNQEYHIVKTILTLDHVPRALTANDTRGLIKLIADKNTDELLGVHIISADAGEVIQTAVLALKEGYTTEKLATTIFPYLTSVEGLKLAAQTFKKDIHKLSCCAG